VLLNLDIAHEVDALNQRWRKCVVLLVCAVLLACAALAVSVARAEDRISDWSTPNDEQCVPTCRDGYECHRGECTPICNPVCAPGLLCTAGGQCVRVESYGAPAPVRRTASSDGCFPSCRDGFACLDNACVSLCNPVCPRGESCSADGRCFAEREQSCSEATPAAAPERTLDRSHDSIVDVHIDVLGALQFGLTPTVEVGKRVSGYLGVRALNTGMASYLALGRDREDEFRAGVGAMLGLHVFSAQRGNLRGFYGGPALEYVFVATRDLKRDFASYRTHMLVPEADFGHRWAFDRFLVGVGVRLALAIPVRDEAAPIGSSGCRRSQSCRENRDVSFVPGLVLDLGYLIPRRAD
jgi:hypothetical protein